MERPTHMRIWMNRRLNLHLIGIALLAPVDRARLATAASSAESGGAGRKGSFLVVKDHGTGLLPSDGRTWMKGMVTMVRSWRTLGYSDC